MLLSSYNMLRLVGFLIYTYILTSQLFAMLINYKCFMPRIAAGIDLIFGEIARNISIILPVTELLFVSNFSSFGYQLNVQNIIMCS